MKEPWIVFFGPDGAELASYTLRGTFSEELQDTIALLAYENGLSASEISFAQIMRSVSRKKAEAWFDEFEAFNPKCEYISLAHDLMNSPAFESLSLRQRGLFLELKRRYRRKREHGVTVKSNRDCIHFPQNDIEKLYGNYNTFKKDLDALVEKGFIRVHSKKNLRQMNDYELIGDWKTWPQKPP